MVNNCLYDKKRSEDVTLYLHSKKTNNGSYMKHLVLFLVFFSSSFYTLGGERLVTIDGSLTEIVYALGANKMLVARDDTSVYPREVFKLPSVGYMRALSTEGVMSVNPSKILITSGAGPKNVLEQLQTSKINVVTIDTKRSLEGVRQKITEVGKAINAEDKTEAVLTQYDADVKALKQLIDEKGSAFTGKKALLFLGMSARQMNAAGQFTKGQAVIDALDMVNGVDHKAFKPLSTESMLSINPEVIIVTTHGPVDKNKMMKMFSFTKAYQNNQIVFIGTAELLGFGPRLPQSLLKVANQLVEKKPTTLAKK